MRTFSSPGKILLTVAFIFGLQAAAGPNEGTPGRGMGISRVASRWRLSVRRGDGRADHFELVGPGTRVVLVPGMALARFGRRDVRLSSPAGFADGELLVPPEVLRLLPKRDFIAYDDGGGELECGTSVVLDPGHGGRDPGAIGHRGLREKDVNLGVALHLRRYLQARGVRVVMTREDDSYPSLQARADLANRTPDSVFISIHANAVSRRRYEVRGVETFVLSNSVSDWKRVRKAAMSFKVRRESGEWLPRSHQRTEIGRICKEARGESIELARSVHGRLVAASGDIDRGVRGKNLHVLRESFFSPAILVELGFLTHPLTARQLASDAHRRRLARALCDGICRYLLQREREEARVALRDNRVKVIANN